MECLASLCSALMLSQLPLVVGIKKGTVSGRIKVKLVGAGRAVESSWTNLSALSSSEVQPGEIQDEVLSHSKSKEGLALTRGVPTRSFSYFNTLPLTGARTRPGKVGCGVFRISMKFCNLGLKPSPGRLPSPASIYREPNG